MSLDISVAIQVAVLAGQAVKLVIDAAQHDRDHACSHPAGGCVQAAVPCPGYGRPGSGCPFLHPWTARTCRRTATRPMERDARRHPHGRHRRC